MIGFEIVKTSKKSRARLGLLKTRHGVVQTPCFVPVATQGAVKAITSEDARKANCQILIANTFHLHLKPGEKVVRESGGLHKFMNWKMPLMTDSGGFQVFSLGFGTDFGFGKIIRHSRQKEGETIKKNRQPEALKITKSGVFFRSPLDGRKFFLGPAESIKIQEKLGADIIFAFDECTAPLVSFEYAKDSLERTHIWAKACLKAKSSSQAIFGIVQGSRFKTLRQQSAGFINSLDFDGFGIGGDLGRSKRETKKILGWTVPLLSGSKPRHLLGIGHIDDIEEVIKSGIDLFDCTVPTHYARRGVAFIADGKINLKQSKFLKDKNPLDKKCPCFVCQNYKRNYICHLIRAKEIAGMSLITFHNLHFFNGFVASIREKIKKGKL